MKTEKPQRYGWPELLGTIIGIFLGASVYFGLGMMFLYFIKFAVKLFTD